MIQYHRYTIYIKSTSLRTRHHTLMRPDPMHLPVLFFGQLFEVDRGHFDQGVIKGCWPATKPAKPGQPLESRWKLWLENAGKPRFA